MVGTSSELPTDSSENQNTRNDVKEETSKKIASIGQDILNLSFKGRKCIPKHTSLAMAVRHLTGSAQLIGILNGLGHCVSNFSVLEHDTALAELQLERGEQYLPPIIKRNVHSILVWDNNDFREETLSGKGSTHNTNGIIIQRNIINREAATESTTFHTSKPKTRKRSIDLPPPPPPASILNYFGGKRQGPQASGKEIKTDEASYLSAETNPTKFAMAYFLSKLPEYETPVPPGWTGFNTKLQKASAVPEKSNIGYLPVIDASPTNLSTVNTILQRSLAIADQLGLETIVVVMDQAIYSKAQQIRWKDAMYMKRIILWLGEFHTSMSFLACVGKRFRDAGLQDVMIESELVAQGSVSTVMNGHHYNRSVRAHKIVAEVLQRLRLQAFLDNLTNAEKEAAIGLCVQLKQTFPGEEFVRLVECEEFQDLLSQYEHFIEV
ncbi:hypothetical protein HOLleu_38358 [Holothuria leucospilota]|uniref:Uncharacterized protein n=1 Tax=Holothuria leucospilota TaxID=206669 RepID=A0A9Q0YJ35_HOLLE|nr:hypothetical protein HOLleu_38358 [Holothuria leucospilota]